MKRVRKLLAIVLSLMIACTMGIGLSTAVFAAGTGTITITLPTDEQAPTQPTTYKIYKVFDATVNATDPTKVSYTLCDGDELSEAMIAAGFTMVGSNVTGPSGDELTETAIAAIKAYVTESDLADTVISEVGDTSVTSSALPYGYYYITTTSGTVVTIDSNNGNPTVADKNVIPSVVKSAGTAYDAESLKAIAAVGTDQPYTAVIKKTKGAYNVVFTDTMTNQTYNGDLKVTVGENEVAAGTTTFSITGAAGDSTFTVTFVDSYIAGLTDGTEITLNYSGKITSDALSVDPATNKATLSSGNGNTVESEEIDVYNAKLTVTKQDGEQNPLQGAGFVVKNEAGKYYCLAADKKSITWYTLTEDETLAQAIAAGKVTEYTSGSDGAVTAFTGLGVGKYTLVESTTPEGYNTADDTPFEIKDKDYTASNLVQTATVVNNPGAELPSTGGIGTTIFYLLGALLVIGCGIVLVARRRMAAK